MRQCLYAQFNAGALIKNCSQAHTSYPLILSSYYELICPLCKSESRVHRGHGTGPGMQPLVSSGGLFWDIVFVCHMVFPLSLTKCLHDKAVTPL